jgi:RNA polymerase sigma-70 factor, ECF subfamily
MALENSRLPPPFEELMQRHEREIMRYLLRVTGHREDAADLFQETFIRAYRAYPRINPDGDLRPWLYTIATNLCRNRARDSARRSRVIAQSSDDPPALEALGKSHRSPHEDEGYAAVRMRELVSGLPAKQRQSLHLRYFAGLEYAEIAAAMGCSEESARANVSQAMKKLKATW